MKTILFVGAALSILAGLYFILNQPENFNKENNKRDINTQSGFSKSIVYGKWTNSSTEIFALDLADHTEYFVARLPLNIKKVTVLSDKKLLYISDVDSKDHGTKLQKMDLLSGEINTVYTADESFGIDDYVTSQDGSKIAVWEVKLSSETNSLIQGTSRVYTSELDGNQSKNIIVDEYIDKPVHYPRALTDQGELFLDTFLPNVGAGWAFGMSISDFNGSTVSNLNNMNNGTYSTQPYISYDEKYLAFAGYSKDDGSELKNGYRQALAGPDRIEILDIATKQRTVLHEEENSLITNAKWLSKDTLALSLLSKDQNKSGRYLLNIQDKTMTYLNGLEDTPVARINQNILLVGTQNISQTALGNLGAEYDSPYTAFSFYDIQKKEHTQLLASNPFMQYLSIVDNSFLDLTDHNKISKSDDTLMLDTFTFKSNLAESREMQQSAPEVVNDEPSEAPVCEQIPGWFSPGGTFGCPLCRDLAAQQCNELYGTNYDALNDLGGLAPIASNEFMTCYNTQLSQNFARGACFDSPLYLYGPHGMEVSIQIHTPIYNTNLPDDGGDYKVTLANDDKFIYQNNIYKSIEFDYKPAVRTKVPLNGRVISKSDIEKNIQDIGKKLGFTPREITDLANEFRSKIVKDFALITFYDQKTSKYILPISFNPIPDTYINYVFYVKNLNAADDLRYTPAPLVFPPIDKRGSFTAVEISVISE